MALKLFKAPSLPKPPVEYDGDAFQRIFRTIAYYFAQLDSHTPNVAESYTADFFYGSFVAKNVTTAEKMALTGQLGMTVFDTDLDKLCVYTSGGWQTITST